MLTLILLVVLGGGAGLMAVWLIDGRGLSGLFGRFDLRSLRPARQPGTTRPDAPEVAATRGRPRPEPPVPAAGEPRLVEEPARPTTTTAVAYEPLEVPLAPLPAPSGRRDGKRVPAAYTAIEGTYRDVARVPLWRKLLSLGALLVVLVLVGVAIAALAGATLGAVAELVDGAVG